MLYILLIALCGLLLYATTQRFPFVFDDYSAVVDNERIRHTGTILRDVLNNRYITNLTFALNFRMGGLRPFGYHLFNSITHVANAVLVFLLAAKLFGLTVSAKRFLTAQGAAFAAAFLFLVHPIQTQSVIYVAQRSTLLAAFFFLLAVLCYVSYRSFAHEQEIHERSLSKRKWFYLLSCFFAIAAVKCKENTATLPLVILAMEITFLGGRGQYRTSFLRTISLLAPFFLISLMIPLSMAVSSSAFLDMGSASEALGDLSRETHRLGRYDYLLTQFGVVATYLRLLIFPVNQTVVYSYPAAMSFAEPRVLFPLGIELLLLLCAVICWKKAGAGRDYLRVVAAGIFWFFLTLLVESSIIPIRDVIFEHRAYLPSVGIFLAGIALIAGMAPSRNTAMAMIIVPALVLSTAGVARTRVWASPETLWTDALGRYPGNIRAMHGLVSAFKEEKEYEKARALLETMLRQNPSYHPTYYHIGDILLLEGKASEAIKYFQKALEFDLSYRASLDTLTSLGIAYSENGENENAVRTFEKILEKFPQEISPYVNLGRQLLRMGDVDRAVKVLEKGLSIRETPQLCYQLSLAFKMKGDLVKEKYFHERALNLYQAGKQGGFR